MSLTFPTLDVRDLVEDLLASLLPDGSLLDAALGNRPAEDRDMIRRALEDRNNRVVLGWNAEQVSDWQITVALAGTAKGARGGGLISDTISHPSLQGRAERDLMADLSADENQAVTFTTGTPDVGDDDGEVAAQGFVRIPADAAPFEYLTYAIASGVCTFRKRGILNTEARAWPSGTPAVFFDEWAQEEGWPEEVTLRLDIGGINSLFVDVVGRLLQGFIARSGEHFEEGGYTLLGCDATDLAPRPPMWPAAFFARTLTVRFLTTLSLPNAYPGITATSVAVTTED